MTVKVIFHVSTNQHAHIAHKHTQNDFLYL